MMNKSIILIQLILIVFFANAQSYSSIEEMSDSLKKYDHLIKVGLTEEERNAANDKLIYYFEKSLKFNNSIDYAYDEVESITKLCSEDKKLRIYTWSVVNRDKSYSYYGYVQSWNALKERYDIYTLEDNYRKIRNPAGKTLDQYNWYGAIYYKLIQTKYKKKTYYTLLGWNGQNRYINMKIIDVLTISSKGIPKFGYNLFVGRVFEGVKMGTEKRILIKYNGESTLLLDYDFQEIEFIKKKNNSYKSKSLALNGMKKSAYKKKFRALKNGTKKETEKKVYKKMNVIVMEKTMPIDDRTKGIYEFYYTDPYFVDGFYWSKGKWRFIENIKPKNKETIHDNPNKPKIIEKGLIPEKKSNDTVD